MNRRSVGWVMGVVVVWIVVAGTFWACSDENKGKKQKETTITIGAILPLTGPGAVFAQYIKEGLDLAVEEINEGSGHHVVIRYEDSKNQPKEGIAAYNGLVSQEHPPVTVVALSSVAKALSPLAEATKTLQIYIAVAIPDVTDGKFRFRVYPEANGMAGVMARYSADKLDANRAAVIYINDDFGRASLDVYRNVFQDHGGQIIFTESYELLQTDFRAQVAKLKDVTPQPDVVYLNGYGPSYGAIVKQLKELEVEAVLTADMTLGLPSTLQQVGDAGEGAYFVDGKMSREFEQKFDAKYSKPATSYAGYSYDIVKILWSIRDNTGSFTVDAIQKGMHKIQDYEGAMGNITIGPDGDSNLEFVVKQVKNGQILVVQE